MARSRVIPVALSMLVALLVAVLVAPASGQDVVVNGTNIVLNIFPPNYFTCVDEPLPLTPLLAPIGAYAELTRMRNVCQVNHGSRQLSGVFLMVLTAARNAMPAGSAVVQTYSSRGTLGLTRQDSAACGDKRARMNSSGAEYFAPGSPAIDLQAYIMCCESTMNVVFQATVAVLPVPPGARPIPTGENAARAYTTRPQANAVVRQVQQNRDISWGFRYEHDGCRPAAPRTSCGNVNCLQTWQTIH